MDCVVHRLSSLVAGGRLCTPSADFPWIRESFVTVVAPGARIASSDLLVSRCLPARECYEVANSCRDSRSHRILWRGCRPGHRRGEARRPVGSSPDGWWCGCHGADFADAGCFGRPANDTCRGSGDAGRHRHDPHASPGPRGFRSACSVRRVAGVESSRGDHGARSRSSPLPQALSPQAIWKVLWNLAAAK